MEQTAGHGDLLEGGGQPVYAEAPLWLSADLFVQVWPTVEHAVLRSLVRRGVSAATAEDVTQEVAVRALDREFESAAHVRRWCTRVAVNLAIDDRRRHRKVELGDTPEGESRSAGDEAVVRLELSRVAAAIAGLSEVDQSVLRMAAAGESVEGEKRDRDRFALQLFRARKRLLDALKGWLGLGAVAEAWRRRRWTVIVLAATAVTALTWQLLLHSSDLPSATDSLGVVPRTEALAAEIASGQGAHQARPSDPGNSDPLASKRNPAGPQRFKTSVEIPAPSGEPLVRVGAEDKGDEPRPLVCLRNLPVVGAYCSPAPPAP